MNTDEQGGVYDARRFAVLRRQLRTVVTAIRRETVSHRSQIKGVLPAHHRSAVNLAHYIGLRKQSVRQMQLDLAGLGLSSLGRSEGHVRDTFQRLEGWLETQRSGAHRQLSLF
jgi:pyruvate kinase